MKVDINSKTINNYQILHDIHVSFPKGITLIVGESGSGKTTLIRELVPGVTKVGKLDGTVIHDEKKLSDIEPGIVGYISQNPDNQIVCDKVWHELAFGLESLGKSNSVIRNRVAEISTYLGIESWFTKNVEELSGGQKQKLCLASVLCMNPSLVIMDEPTSMLDPISSREFLELVIRLRDEMGIDFIIAEHNTDFIYEKADLILSMSNGTLSEEIPLSKIQSLTKEVLQVPCDSIGMAKNLSSLVEVHPKERKTTKVKYSLKNLRKNFKDKLAINIPSLDIYEGITCIIGPNGSGKSTLGKLITGFYGKKLIKRSVLLPQDVLITFVKDNVYDELDCINDIKPSMVGLVENLYKRHPLDISGGEQHIVAVCKTLLYDADLYIFDEPTKGMDQTTTKKIEGIIKENSIGKSVIIITHDLELVSRIADRVIFLFNAEIASEGEPHKVLCDNTLYKPLASRIWDGAILGEEVW